MRSSRHTAAKPLPELSVVIAVRNDEEVIGHLVRRVSRHLQELGRTFEIVAVNDGCHDNSLSLLDLLAARTPELRVIRAFRPGRAFLRGASEARGALVLLIDASKSVPLAPLGWALSRIHAGREAVILRGRYIVGRRLILLPVIVRASGPGLLFERVFEKRAVDLGVDVVGTRPKLSTPAARLLAPVLRFLAA